MLAPDTSSGYATSTLGKKNNPRLDDPAEVSEILIN